MWLSCSRELFVVQFKAACECWRVEISGHFGANAEVKSIAPAGIDKVELNRVALGCSDLPCEPPQVRAVDHGVEVNATVVSRPVELFGFQTYFSVDVAESRVTLRVATGFDWVVTNNVVL
jgi:hypothetical protein